MSDMAEGYELVEFGQNGGFRGQIKLKDLFSFHREGYSFVIHKNGQWLSRGVSTRTERPKSPMIL